MNLSAAIRAVQAQLRTRGAYSGEIDGIAGEQTWGAIASALGVDLRKTPNTEHRTPKAFASGQPNVGNAEAGSSVTLVGDQLAKIAESQIGTQEDAKHTNQGSAILKYQEATSLDAPSRSGGEGWPWCAAFVDWCVKQLLLDTGGFPGIRPKITFQQRPETATAFGLIDWAREQNRAIVFTPRDMLEPQRGDIVVFEFSHCGIVADVDPERETFHAIEGNSNTDGGRDGFEVVRHARNLDSVRRFIRLSGTGNKKIPV